MTEKNREELPLHPFSEPKPYGVFEESIQVRQLHFYISGLIEEPELYMEMIHQIQSATSNDIVHIHLNTPGGHVATGVQIINAVEAAQALVVTHLEGEVCSMGALIFLAGHQMLAYDHSILMFHNYSGGMIGKGHEMKSAIEATEKWYSTIQQKICSPFLTKVELKKIKEGQDIWMQHDEITRRLEKLQKAYDKEQAKLDAAADEEDELS